MKFKNSLVALSIAAVALSGGILVNADTVYSGNYPYSLPGNNGYTVSHTQTKTLTNASADLIVSKVNGFGTMDVRAIGGGPNSTGAWVRNVNNGTYAIPNPTSTGWTNQLQFSSDLFSPGGTFTANWRSN